MNLALLPRTEFSGLDTTFRADAQLPTKATTGTLEVITHAPCTGSLSRATMTFKDGLSKDDTNFITVTLVNKGAAASGTTQMLASSPAGVNTTKVTGGATLVAYLAYVLTLSATGSDLRVNAGDVLVFSIAASGTLANTLTEGFLRLSFTPD